jgi:hypothetical protein
MNRTRAKLISNRIEAALKDLESELDVTIEVKGSTFSDTWVNVRLTVCEKDENGETQSRDREEYIAHAEFSGMKPEWFGKEFTSRGTTYVLDGYSARSYKFPCRATRTKDGKRFKFGADAVKVAFLCAAVDSNGGK